MRFLAELAQRQRFGICPGLDNIRGISAALGNPQNDFKAIHIAGTNGKGAVSAMIDAALRAEGLKIGRYTSPHLVRLNERFFLNGEPVDDQTLDDHSRRIDSLLAQFPSLTFFEALTAVAYLLYAAEKVDYAVLECGLGGRLDATNVCRPAISIVTKIGLDHCDWLGDTVEKIAAEKSGIIKAQVPVVLAKNSSEVRAVVERTAKALNAPFYYAPDLADELEIPEDISLKGSFNRENAVTAIAAIKVLRGGFSSANKRGLANVVWPGRFQTVGNFIVDGAHNPPAAKALSAALPKDEKFNLIAGFCGDKAIAEVLSILAPHIERGFAVKTNNPRSLTAIETAAKMESAGIPAIACESLTEALRLVRGKSAAAHRTLICGSLFLSGEALVALDAYPWSSSRFDPSEQLHRR